MNIFEAKNLTISLQEKIILENLNFSIKKNEFLVLTGSNGSGKTILAKTLLNLLDEFSGDIFFENKKIKENLNNLRTKTFFVFQDAEVQIIGETVFEDLSFTLQNSEHKDLENEKIDKILQFVDLKKQKHELARNLSGGQKRKLAIANALLKDSEIIFFDEVFANLDFFGVKQVLKILEILKKQQKTIILITHELEKVINLTDRIIILGDKTVKILGETSFVLKNLKQEFGVHHPNEGWF